MNISIILLSLLSFLLIWRFVCYPSLMAIVSSKSSLIKIVPTYNEEKVIEKRIKNLFELDYPKSQI